MKRNYAYFTILTLAILLFWSGCATTKTSKTSLAGIYNYVLNTPMGEQKGYLEIIEEGKKYLANIGSDQGSMGLSDLVIEGQNLKASFDFQGYKIDMSGTFNGDIFDGKLVTQGFEMPFQAVRESK